MWLVTLNIIMANKGDAFCIAKTFTNVWKIGYVFNQHSNDTFLGELVANWSSDTKYLLVLIVKVVF